METMMCYYGPIMISFMGNWIEINFNSSFFSAYLHGNHVIYQERIKPATRVRACNC